MQDGDMAGLAVFQNPYAFIGVKNQNGSKYVVMVNNGKAIDSTSINSSTFYLRAMAKYGTSSASFAYSLDNQSFIKLGNQLYMQFNLSIFTGNKFCLFNYATIATGGFVDFDWFRIDLPTQTKVVPEENFPLNETPHGFFLGQNYPNPFNPTTVIRYQLPTRSNLSLKVYDLLGQEITALFEGVRQPGIYEATFDGSKRVGGVYFYRLTTSTDFVQTKKLLLLK
jgi:hypothetical protein